MEQENRGVLIAPPRPKDYILGSTSPIAVIRNIKDWSPYLPKNESQANKKEDFLICTTMSGPDHSIATQINYLISTGKMSDEAMNFFHNNNYLVDGLFSLSARFNAKLNGTEALKGQYLNVAADCVRRDGILPEIDWPTTLDMSWTEFYSQIPVGLFAKAKKALWFLDIQYHWVESKDIQEALQIASVQVATEICAGWDSGHTVPKCSGGPIQHATMLYGQDQFSDWLDFDQYPPYKQTLAKDYEFPSNLQYVVTMKPLCLRNGMAGANVLQLQKNLNKLGFILTQDGGFGPKTEMQVKSFQNKTGLVPDGIAGEKTLNKLQDMTTQPRTILEAIIQVESNGNDGAIGDQNLTNHAYGCLQIRQGVCDAVNSHFDTNFKAQDCLGNRAVSLAIWEKYWKVYPLFTTNEEKSRVWNGGPGWKQIYFKPNKTDKEIQYCKNLDIYWTKVKSLL